MRNHLLLAVFLTIAYGSAAVGSLTNWPENQYGTRGTSITMRCSSTRGSNSITWFLLPVINSVNVTIASLSTVSPEYAQLFRIEQPTPSDSNLIIYPVNDSTAGTYTCSDGETFAHAQFMVLHGFTQVGNNASDYVIVGEAIMYTCQQVYVDNPFFVPIFHLVRVDLSPIEYIDITTSPQLEKSNSLSTATAMLHQTTPCTSNMSMNCVIKFGQPVGDLLPGSATNAPSLAYAANYPTIKVLCPSVTGAISGATLYSGGIITCHLTTDKPVNYSWTDFTYGNSSMGPQLTIWHNGSYQCMASINASGSASWKSVTKAIHSLTVERQSIKAKPLYGPIAGGTKVNFALEKWSKEVANISAVYFGDFLRITDLQSDSFGNNVLITTPDATAALIGQPLPILIELTPGPYNISINLSFTYQRNPEITGISPSTFVATGGTIVNVTGTNLSSVAYPLIQIRLVVIRGTEKYTTYKTGPCEVNAEGNRMACRMPSVDIPDDFLQFLDSKYNSRATRDTNSMNHLKASNTFILSRRKRYANALNLTLPNGVDTLDIYVGFILDGYHKYENINDLLPDTRILIFSPPEINFTKNIIEFDPEKDTSISIEGNHMTRGCRLVDYVVQVGSGACENIDLTDNELRCRPPKQQPQSTQNGSFNCDQLLSIYIQLGYRTYQYACMKYPARLPVLIIGLAVGIPSFVIVILLIIAIVCCCKKSRNQRNKSTDNGLHSNTDAVNEPPSDQVYANAMYLRPSNQSYADDEYLRPAAQ